MDVFGSVADLYETARPGYPPAIADAIAGFHGRTPASVTEIGAGTGKGTEVLSRIGAPMTCVEPDPRMAALLSRRFPQARVEPSAFEEWSGRTDVLACAMAWHWLDPDARNQRARECLAPDGTLAVFGHRYDYADRAQGDAVQTALWSVDRNVTERPADWFHRDIAGSGQFTGVRAEVFRRDLPLGKEQYLALISTFGPFLKRSREQQERALEALGRMVDDHGGTVVLDLRTTLVLARRP